MSTEQSPSSFSLRMPCSSTFFGDDHTCGHARCRESPAEAARVYGLHGMGGSTLSDLILPRSSPGTERKLECQTLSPQPVIPKRWSKFSQSQDTVEVVKSWDLEESLDLAVQPQAYEPWSHTTGTECRSSRLLIGCFFHYLCPLPP